MGLWCMVRSQRRLWGTDGSHRRRSIPRRAPAFQCDDGRWPPSRSWSWIHRDARTMASLIPAQRCRACGSLHPSGAHPMPENLAGPMAEALCVWARTKGFTVHQVSFACETVRDWGVGKRKKCWVATVRNAMRKGWGLEGYVPRSTAPPQGPRTPKPMLVYRSPEWHRAQGDL